MKKKTEIKGDIISIAGFKSLVKEQSIEIRPLTILAGANSSGKTSIIQPLLLLKQTIESPYDPGALLLNGPNVRITSVKQILSRTSSYQYHDNFYIKYDSSAGWIIKLTFKKSYRKGFEIESIFVEDKKKNKKMSIKPIMSKDEIESIAPGWPIPFKDLFESIKKGKRELEWIVLREKCFFSIQLREIGSDDFRVGFSPMPPLKERMEDIIHVPALRGNPERTYKTTAVGDKFPGVFQEYVASIIRHWQRTKSDKLKMASKALEQLGLTWKIEAKAVDDTQVELRVGRLPHKGKGQLRDFVNIADAGFGLSQVLPVIVSILTAKQGQIVYLEEPEIHLHPKAQLYLTDILAEAAKRKVNIIVETHSSLILRRIQTLVAKGEVSKDLIKLHWFNRTEEGATEIFSSELDSDGSFGGWPEDFDEIYLCSEKDYLDAVEKGFQ